MATLASPPSAPVQIPTFDEFIEQQLTEQGFAVNEERIQKIRDYYEQECLKAIESDTWLPGTPDFWDKLRQEAHQRREARKASAARREQ